MTTAELLAHPTTENWEELILSILRRERQTEIEQHGSAGFYVEQLVVLCESRFPISGFNRAIVNTAISNSFARIVQLTVGTDEAPNSSFQNTCTLLDCDLRLGFFDRSNAYSHREEILNLAHHAAGLGQKEREVALSAIANYFLAYFHRLPSAKQDLETVLLVKQMCRSAQAIAPEFGAEWLALRFLGEQRRKFVTEVVDSTHWDSALRYVLSYGNSLLAHHLPTGSLLREAIRKHGMQAKEVIESSGYLVSSDFLTVIPMDNSGESIGLIDPLVRRHELDKEMRMVAEWQSVYTQELALATTIEEY